MQKDKSHLAVSGMDDFKQFPVSIFAVDNYSLINSSVLADQDSVPNLLNH